MFAAAVVSICSVAYFPLHSICKSYFQGCGLFDVGDYSRSNDRNRNCLFFFASMKNLNNLHLESNVETVINCVKWNKKCLMVWNCAALNKK